MRHVVRYRFCWILSIQAVDQFRGGSQEFRRFPGEFVVANPADEVFQILADKFGVKDLFNLKFDVVVHDY